MVYASLTPNSMHTMERTMRIEDQWHYYYPQRRRTPSFSSTLLDSIYRSIDESKSNLDENPQLGLSTTTTPKTQSNLTYHNNNSIEKSYNNKEKMTEDWMEKKQNTPSHSSKYFVNSTTSTSSESSSMFSSSDTDTTHHKPKQRPMRNKINYSEKNQKKPKRDSGGGFARTKLRALKIYYGELNQKVMMKQKKQPISPGSRIASFLSSIFNNTAGNVKKPKMCYVGAVEDVTRTSFDGHNKSKSPSSFSTRSCMTKTTSLSSSSSSKGKRSVRFYPVNMILGEEDSQHCIKEVKKKKKNCVNVAKENGFNIKGYQNSCKGTDQFGFRGSYDDGDEDGDDDALSYSSSDLFELDHLIGAGISRFQEELPVYETTNLETNKAIANGLRL